MEGFYVYFNISSNLEKEKLLHRYEMFYKRYKKNFKR